MTLELRKIAHTLFKMLTNEQAKTMDQGLLMVSPGIDSRTNIMIVRSRFQQKDMRLMNALDGEHQYLCEQVDPIISQGLHSVMLLQPTRVETFFGAYWKGNVPEKITKSVSIRSCYVT